MLTSPKKILSAIGWTTGSYVLSVIVRFGTSVLLTRLLTPELYGSIILINIIRVGIDLMTTLESFRM